MSDLRLQNIGEATKYRQMLTAAIIAYSDRVVSYAVMFGGHKVTALGFKRGENDFVPLAILLSDNTWADIPHLAGEEGDMGPVKEWPPK